MNNSTRTNCRPECRFVKSEPVVYRKIAGEHILVPIRKRADEAGKIFTMNETGGKIWEFLNGEKSVQEIVEHLIDFYEVDSGEALEDACAFISQLSEAGLIKEV